MCPFKRKALLFSVLAPVALALTFGAGGASADSVTYTLSGSNLNAPFTGPYGTVTVNRTSTTAATITFDSLSNGTYLYLFGGNDAVGANVSGTFSLGAITGTGLTANGFTPGPYSNGGSGSENGFGTFSQIISSFDGFTHSSTEISFGVAATGTNTWATAGSVLTANAQGIAAAAHIFACTIPCTAANGAATTGYAAVPIPAAVWLFGSGLIGLIGIARRKLAA